MRLPKEPRVVVTGAGSGLGRALSLVMAERNARQLAVFKSAPHAKRVDAADWESKDGHYRVRIDGEWVDVPSEAVVDGPNLAGRTMVWPYYRDGHPRARCFMPGSMS